jgi:hypothetical protein
LAAASHTCLERAAAGDCGVKRASSARPSRTRFNEQRAWALAARRSTESTPFGNFRRCSSSARSASSARPPRSALVARDNSVTSSASRSVWLCGEFATGSGRALGIDALGGSSGLTTAGTVARDGARMLGAADMRGAATTLADGGGLSCSCQLTAKAPDPPARATPSASRQALPTNVPGVTAPALAAPAARRALINASSLSRSPAAGRSPSLPLRIIARALPRSADILQVPGSTWRASAASKLWRAARSLE